MKLSKTLSIALFLSLSSSWAMKHDVEHIFPGNPYTNPRTYAASAAYHMVNSAANLTYLTSLYGHRTQDIVVIKMHDKLFQRPIQSHTFSYSDERLETVCSEVALGTNTFKGLYKLVGDIKEDLREEINYAEYGLKNLPEYSQTLNPSYLQKQSERPRLTPKDLQETKEILEKLNTCTAFYKTISNKKNFSTIVPIKLLLFNQRHYPFYIFNSNPYSQAPISFTIDFLRHFMELYPEGYNIISLFRSYGHLSCLRVKVRKTQINITEFDTGSVALDKIHLYSMTSQFYFQQIAEHMNLKLNFNYIPLGHQTLNMHDCGRFSFVYLLALVGGKNPAKLTPYDIYTGMQYLEVQDFEEFHYKHYNDESTTELYVRKLETVSRFAQVTRLLKWPAYKLLEKMAR